jgi:uncharacterized protein (TIGR03086 family)
MSEDAALFARAAAGTARVAEQVRPQQYDDPTPCSEWSVRTLLNHMVAGNRYFAVSARGQRPDAAVWAEDHLGDRPAGSVYSQTAEQAVQAWAEPGAAERAATLPSGDPGPLLLHIHLVETVVHGWDLATAIGRRDLLDEEVAEAAYAAFAGKMPPEIRGTNFGPEVPADPGAPAADRLAAYLGRTPPPA